MERTRSGEVQGGEGGGQKKKRLSAGDDPRALEVWGHEKGCLSSGV